jgi:hypothetical protein
MFRVTSTTAGKAQKMFKVELGLFVQASSSTTFLVEFSKRYVTPVP